MRGESVGVLKACGSVCVCVCVGCVCMYNVWEGIIQEMCKVCMRGMKASVTVAC